MTTYAMLSRFHARIYHLPDASGYGTGAVLAQTQSSSQSADLAETNEPELCESDGVEVVIAYTSKHLNDCEAKCSTTEKEAYGIVHAIEPSIFRFLMCNRGGFDETPGDDDLED
ncbi:hypothetical protein OUZ56_030051 [Daphnia magna]|uniref:Reverse transcriptase RNase H-like domain-containing protein n=1 Tax=Daphnia magna TaxID=35525 RepID=A0ABQ9ZQ66_9CRUS|nr:hypothetical protein OUZ56_030051 [Daphnia magna]